MIHVRDKSAKRCHDGDSSPSWMKVRGCGERMKLRFEDLEAGRFASQLPLTPPRPLTTGTDHNIGKDRTPRESRNQ
jgi:hypothetical protein